MREFLRRTFEVAVPPAAVWSHLVRVERWPTWARHIRSASLVPAGPLGPTSRGAFVVAPGIRTEFRMVAWEPQRRWKWRGGFLWLTVDYDHLVEPTPSGGTRVTFVVEGQGAAAGSLGRLFAAAYARNLDRAIPRLRAELESPPPSAA